MSHLVISLGTPQSVPWVSSNRKRLTIGSDPNAEWVYVWARLQMRPRRIQRTAGLSQRDISSRGRKQKTVDDGLLIIVGDKQSL